MRWLVFLLLAGCASFDGPQGTRAGTDETVMVYAINPAMQCPPSDGYQWRRAEIREPTRYTWLVLPVADFRRVCGGEACASGLKIIATSPRYTKREGLVQHEECHLLGWKHE